MTNNEIAEALQTGDICQYRKVGKVEILRPGTHPGQWVVKFLTGPKTYKALVDPMVWLTPDRKI